MTMMKQKPAILLFYFLALFFSISIASAQQHSLKGKVVNKGKSPVAFVHATLLKSNTFFVEGLTTDSLGTFLFKTEKGNYRLILKQFGQEFFSKTLEIDQDIELGEIEVDESILLQEVTITARKKLIEQKVDRLVFNVENSLISSGGNAIDVLQNAPRIRVSNETISIIGKSGVKLMVNNKLIPLSDKDLVAYLKTIKSEDIAKIEVITTPPANFEAEGNSGLINIILKSSTANMGFSGRMNSSFTKSTHESGTIGASLNYKNKKIQVLSAISVGDGATGPTLANFFYFPTETWKTENKRKDYYTYLSGRWGLEYAINHKNSIGFQYLANLSEWDIDANETTFIAGQSTNRELNTISLSDNKSSSHSLNANFKHVFDTIGRELTIDIDYLHYDSKWDRKFDTHQFETIVSQSNSSDLGIGIYSGKLHFNLPFSFGTFETGGKISFAKNNSDITYSPMSNENSSTNVPIGHNDFVYRENTQAIYTSFSKSFSEKMDLKAGLRIENTQLSFHTLETKMREKSHYTKLFPTFYLTYKLDKNRSNTLSLNYSRRIGRPNYMHLNPFRWYNNPFVYTEGNPSLQPSFTDNMELSHTFRNLISTLYFSYVKSGFGQVTITPAGTHNQITRSENYYNGTQVGWSESFSFHPLTFWESYNQAVVYYSDSKATIKGIHPNQSGFGSYVSSNNKLSLNAKETMALELNYSYQFPESYGLTSTNGYGQFDLGFNIKLLKNKFLVTGNVSDLFGTSRPKSTSFSNDVKQIYANYFDVRSFRIGLAYNFGGGKIKGGQRSTSNEDERSRIGI